MARAGLEDLGGSIDIVFFPKTYAKFSALLQSESPVLIKGNVAGEPTRPELHADEIMPLLDAWTRRTSRLSIVVAARDAGGERLASLRRVLDLVPGPVPVQLELRLESGAEAVFELPSHKVRVTQELVQDLDQILGTGAARCRVA